MRICVVSDQVFPAWGGEGVSTQNLCMKLSERGHRLICLTSKVPYPPQVKGIRVIRFPSIYISQRGYFGVTLFTQIESILKGEEIQIVHINLPTFLGWQSLLAAKRLNIPCVLGLHVQVGNVIPPDMPCFDLLGKALEVWFSYFYKRGDILVAPSNLGKRILSRYSPRKVEVVSNGVDLRVFNYERIPSEKSLEFRRRFSLDKKSFLLYVGRLSKEKNVGYLLKIMKVLKERKQDVKLVVVGVGKLKEELIKRAKIMSLSETVIFTGFIPKEELLYAYKEADILILPSFYELESIVILEGMAMKNVVLVGKSDQNAACELVKEGVNGYTFSLTDPQDAADKIQTVLSDFRLKERMKEASFILARKYDIEKSISKMEEIYRNLVEEPKQKLY